MLKQSFTPPSKQSDNQRIVLVSFADSRFRNSLRKIERQTRAFPFTERHIHDETNCLTKAYWRRLKPWLYRRGYGYWEWKARLVEHYMRQLAEGDILVYSDAGLWWNATPEAINRFGEYLAMLTGGTEAVAFAQPYIEREWTKGDVLEALGAYDDSDIFDTPQFWGGLFLLRKSSATTRLLERWNDVNRRERELITDRRSLKPNKPGFKEHRHDQSAFSILVKKIPHGVVPFHETHITGGKTWRDMDAYPIQARRDKERDRPMREVLRNKLLRPWRMALGVYFRHCRHYHFLCGGYPW